MSDEPNGTVFPQYTREGDGSPGDQDPGHNLESYPYGEPIFDSDPLADGPPPVQVSSTMAGDDRAAESREPEQSQPQPEPQGGNRRRTAAQRIQQLTARYRTTENERDALADKVQQLASLLEIQNQKISSLTANPGRSSPSRAPTGADDVLAGLEAGSAPQQAAGGFDESTVSRIVQQAIAPLVQRVTQQDEAAALRSEHEASFARAVQEFPELGKPGSEANQAFAELYRSHPLRSLADGPEQLAYIVRGILSDARRQEQVGRARKIQASGPVPSPTTTDVLPPSQGEQHRKVLDVARERLRGGDHSFAVYRALRKAGGQQQ